MTENTQGRTEELGMLLQVGVIAADLWSLDTMSTPMTNAERTRGVVETAVMHLIEQGLLVIPDDLGERLEQGVDVKRETS